MGGGNSKSKDKPAATKTEAAEARQISTEAAGGDSSSKTSEAEQRSVPPQGGGSETRSFVEETTASVVEEPDQETSTSSSKETKQRKSNSIATTPSAHRMTSHRDDDNASLTDEEFAAEMESYKRRAKEERRKEKEHQDTLEKKRESLQAPSKDKQKKKKLLNGTSIEFRYPSGSRYYGGFKDGKLHGYGRYQYYPSGDEYEGEWWNDMKHGHGTYTYESADKYVGEWRYGKKHGKGNYTFASGDEYVGSWKVDKIHGYGVFVIVRNGNRYEGEWEDSYRHGYGELISGNGDKYEGHWIRGKEEGHGVLSYVNGNHYCGEWKLGQMDGKGILIDNGVKHLVEHISGYMISSVQASPQSIDSEWAAVWQLAALHVKKLESNKTEQTKPIPAELTAEMTKLKMEKEILERKYQELLASNYCEITEVAADEIREEDLREKLSELMKQSQIDQRRLREYQAREESMKASIQELEFTKQKLDERSSELNSLKQELDTARGRLPTPHSAADATKQRQSTDQQFGVHDGETIKMLELQVLTLQERMKDSKTEDLLELQARLELAESTNTELEKKLADRERVLIEVEEMKKKHSKFLSKEKELLQEIKNLREKVQISSEQLESEKTDNREEAGMQAQDHAQALSDKDTRIKELEDKSRKTKKKAKELESRSRVAEEKLKISNQANNDLTIKLQDVKVLNEIKESLANSEAANQKLKTEIESYEVQITNLSNSLSETAQLRETVEEMKEKNTKLEETSQNLSQRAEILEEKFKDERQKARRLFNTIEDMKGKIRVYARTRPQLKSEVQRGDRNVLTFPEEMAIRVFDEEKMKEKKEFIFDSCFPGNSRQDEVFEDCRHLIQSAIDGFNVCIFAYGQTGSGKTYTLAGTEQEPGVAPRSMTHLFENLSSMTHYTSVVTCYMVELYNDKLYDLLFKPSEIGGDAPRLDIKKDPNGTVTVQGVTVTETPTLSDLEKVYIEGQSNRHVRATKMNDASSRSHLIFSIIVETTNNETRQTSIGKLSIVDLAGSERLAKTGVEDPIAIAEAQSINLSLTALGNVISALSSGKGHIPYRDNKLTMLMSDSLGGNAKTLMFVNISPSAYNTDETSNSLTYASRVKLIKNSPQKVIETMEIKRLKITIEKLRQGIAVDLGPQEIQDRTAEETPPVTVCFLSLFLIIINTWS